MRRAQTCADIAVKILVKQISVRGASRTGVGLAVSRGSLERTLAVLIARPDFDQAIRELVRDIFQMHELAGAGRAFHFEIVAVIMMKLLERFDEEIIDREPD